MAADTEAPDFVQITTSEKPAEIEKVLLFKIDDEEFYIPKKIKANVGIKYNRDVYKYGVQVAEANLLATVLGEKQMDALADCDDLDDDQERQIMEIMKNKIFGPQEKNRGNSGRGPKR